MQHPYLKVWRKFNDVKPFDFSKLKYHSSWDWLMPVYYKPRYIKVATSFKLHWAKLMGKLVKSMIEGDITETHKAIFKAIEWYNNQVNIDKK